MFSEYTSIEIVMIEVGVQPRSPWNHNPFHQVGWIQQKNNIQHQTKRRTASSTYIIDNRVDPNQRKDVRSKIQTRNHNHLHTQYTPPTPLFKFPPTQLVLSLSLHESGPLTLILNR